MLKMGLKNNSLFDIYWCEMTKQNKDRNIQDIINIAVKGYELGPKIKFFCNNEFILH